MFNFYKFTFCKFGVNEACSIDIGIDKHLSVPFIESIRFESQFVSLCLCPFDTL